MSYITFDDDEDVNTQPEHNEVNETVTKLHNFDEEEDSSEQAPRPQVPRPLVNHDNDSDSDSGSSDSDSESEGSDQGNTSERSDEEESGDERDVAPQKKREEKKGGKKKEAVKPKITVDMEIENYQASNDGPEPQRREYYDLELDVNKAYKSTSRSRANIRDWRIVRMALPMVYRGVSAPYLVTQSRTFMAEYIGKGKNKYKGIMSKDKKAPMVLYPLSLSDNKDTWWMYGPMAKHFQAMLTYIVDKDDVTKRCRVQRAISVDGKEYPMDLPFSSDDKHNGYYFADMKNLYKDYKHSEFTDEDENLPVGVFFDGAGQKIDLRDEKTKNAKKSKKPVAKKAVAQAEPSSKKNKATAPPQGTLRKPKKARVEESMPESGHFPLLVWKHMDKKRYDDISTWKAFTTLSVSLRSADKAIGHIHYCLEQLIVHVISAKPILLPSPADIWSSNNAATESDYIYWNTIEVMMKMYNVGKRLAVTDLELEYLEKISVTESRGNEDLIEMIMAKCVISLIDSVMASMGIYNGSHAQSNSDKGDNICAVRMRRLSVCGSGISREMYDRLTRAANKSNETGKMAQCILCVSQSLMKHITVR